MLKNLCRGNIKMLRIKHLTTLSRRSPDDKIQLIRIDVNNNPIQHIECEKGFIADIELYVFSEILGVSLGDLIK